MEGVNFGEPRELSVALGEEWTHRNERQSGFYNLMKNINTSACVPLAATRLLLLALLCLLSGCLSRPPLHTQTVAFDPPAGSVPKESARSERVVTIRSMRVAAPFEDRSLVYRVGDFSYESDPYAAFLVSPAESLRVPIRSWMRQSDLFRSVVEPGSALRPNTMAEITVVELYGDFRPDPAAVLTLRFVLLDSPEGIPGKLVFEQEYSRRVVLKDRNANALMTGWNEALNQILGQLGSDLRRLDSARGS
jgi:cholesterol transport system auxiliary component